MGTGYVFQNILLCLLAAGLLGAIVGWLLKTFLSAGRLTEIEDKWRGKVGTVESERDALALRLRETEETAGSWKTRFSGLDNQFGKLKLDFDSVTGKIPGLEAAAAASAAAVAKLTSDLKACADVRGKLEAQVADWTAKGKLWDTERARIDGELKTAQSEAGKLRTDLAASAKAKTDLEGSWKTRFTSLEGERDQFRMQLTDFSTKAQTSESGYKTRIADLELQVARMRKEDDAEDAAFRKEIAELKVSLSGANDRYAVLVKERDAATAEITRLKKEDAAEDAAFRKEIGDLKTSLQASNDRSAVLVKERDAATAEITRLKKEDAAEDAAFRKEIADLRARLGHQETESKALNDRYLLLVKERDDAQGSIVRLTRESESLSAASAKDLADLRARIAALEADGKSLYEQHLIAIRERDNANATIERMKRTDEAENAEFKREIESLKQQLAHRNDEFAAAQSRIGELDAAHRKAVADDHADDAAYERKIASLQAELEQMQNERAALTARLAEVESAWTARYSALEAKASAPMAMAAAAGAGAVATSTVSDAQYRRLQSRFDSMVERTQKDGYGDIERIEGIGPAFGQKLRAIGIAWVRELLEQGASPAGRARIVEDTGIKPDLILRWVNAADLLRVEGVTPDWAELLEASGVDTVKELRNRVPANLQKKMEETNPTNGKGTYAREVPSVDTVARWIELAKRLEPKVTH